MSDSYWFGETSEVPTEILLKKIEELEQRILKLEEKLEDENVETSNCLYELMNSTEAIDRRIDILAEQCGCI
jgi:hypothetical protein